MRCTLLGGLCVFCILLAINIAIVLFSQSSSCPLGTFRCLDNETGVCLPRRLLCDGRMDCPDGSDENPYKCSDSYGELHHSFFINAKQNSNTDALPTMSPFSVNCSAKAYPAGCVCKNRTWLSCRNLTSISVPQVDARLSRLVLINSPLKRLSAKDLENYDLELIQMNDSLLEVIDGDAFHHQRNIKKIILEGNKLTNISDGTFAGLDRVEWLFLQRNQLSYMNMKVLQTLASLWWLDLSQNNLNIELGNIFPRMDSLLDLFLGDNRIEMIRNDTVASLINLVLLDLRHNLIRTVNEDAFVTLTRLKFLDLSYNMLEYVPETLFRSQHNLTQLRLGFNPIHHVPAGLFLSLVSLRSLRLEDIELPDISCNMFAAATKLDTAYNLQSSMFKIYLNTF